jgi:translation initiation factor 1
MGKKKNKKIKFDGFYSTADSNGPSVNHEEQETLPPHEQQLEALLEKKGRGGKTAVIVTGFVGSNEDLKDLAKTLKTKCGVGGSARDGEILIQGDVRNKVMDILKEMGFAVKRVGG